MKKAELPSEDPRLISYQTLRKAVGWLAVGLPPAMLVGNLLLNSCTAIQDSISDYYYTITGSLFIAILCSNAIFLLAYKGYDALDNRSTNFAGLAAIFIAFFPTRNESLEGCNLFHLPISSVTNTIHLVSAAAFFLTLAYISLFLFTKSRGGMTKEKKTRNNVYKICGWVIIISLILIATYWLFLEGTFLDKFKPVFVLESIALLAFGTSWLVKGELVLEDE